jgi:aminoglycoside 3-N-acetyltransferase
MTVSTWRRAHTPASELPALALELAMRQTYFRSRRLFDWRRKRHSAPAPQFADVTDVRQRLTDAGMRSGELVMAHTSVTNVTLTGDDGEKRTNSSANALLVLELLEGMLGKEGTLVLPTHPHYRADPGYHFHDDKSTLVLRYDPRRTPTRNGLVNEFFRTQADVQRSLHPLQSVSARGPLAASLLDGNLFDDALPHGVNSSYARVAERNGLVIGLGTPLIESLTIVHMGEDLRDADWPAPQFFRRRRFIVSSEGIDREWRVRERRPLFARAYAEGQLHRDLLAEGILHESSVGSYRVDWLHSGELLAYLRFRNERSPYPFFTAGVARWG